jgi:integrase
VKPKLHRPGAVKREKPTLRPQQIQALIVGLTEQERLYILVIAKTGIRTNEGLAFRWLDFDEVIAKFLSRTRCTNSD